jgi:biotin carboxyl carrier protein
MIYDVNIDGTGFRLELNRSLGRWTCRLDGRDVEVDAVLVRPNVLSLRIGNRAFDIKSDRLADDWRLWVGSRPFPAQLRDPRSLRGRTRRDGENGPQKIAAPMPGKIVRLLVGEGDPVALGEGILVMEAMKMQNEIKSPKSGIVRKILVGQGAAVNPGDLLAIVE